MCFSGGEIRGAVVCFSGAKIRGAVVCFSGVENRGSLALVLCVCVPVQKKNCSSRFLYSIKNPDLYSRFG